MHPVARQFLVVVLTAVVGAACANPAPKTIEQLRAGNFDVELVRIGPVKGGEGFDAYLVAYESGGLGVHALVAVPEGLQDKAPVLVANHGHHPDPPRYGITADGTDWRPGDYYRQIPALFTREGFIVVMPDFRGHSSSEGAEFTEGMLESAYYTEDVVTLLSALDQIEFADTDNVFMWGHSMGGEISLRSVVISDRIKGASMWSSVGGDIWDQSYYYSRYENPHAPDSSDVDKPVVTRLEAQIADLSGPYDTDSNEPLNYLQSLQTPLIIHHSVDDTGAAYKWSVELAEELYRLGKKYEFYSYPGSDHLFTGDALNAAVERDAQFFRNLME